MRNKRILALLLLMVALVSIVPELSTASTTEHSTKQSTRGASRDIDAEIVNEIEKAGGNRDFAGLDSNQITKKLKNKEYATEITKEEAVVYTKKGITVIVCLEGKPKGHVAEIAPADMVDSKSAWGMVPMVFSPGGKNGMLPLSKKFSTADPSPKFYIRNVDMKEAARR